MTALSVAQPRAPAAVRREVRRQLITARLTELLVLGSIDRLCLPEDLAGDLIMVAVGIAARIRRDLGAIDRDYPSLHQTRIVFAGALDRPRRTHPTRIRVEQ